MGEHHHHDHGCGCSHEADDTDHILLEGDNFSLFKYIDNDKIICLNESVQGAAKKIFKPYEQRKDRTFFVQSDADEQLIIIPSFNPNNPRFTGQVKLKSIALLSEAGDCSPSAMKAYEKILTPFIYSFVNQPSLDFDTIDDTDPTQEWELAKQEVDNHFEYLTKVSKFSNVQNLTLYFPSNFGDDTTKIYYIGLKGEFTKMNSDPIITIYELAPNLADHKNPASETTNNTIQ